MQKAILSTTIFLFYLHFIYGQAIPIGLDGKFDDWSDNAASYTDTQNDGADFDLLSFKVANDSNFLFIRFAVNHEIQLNYGNNLYLEIDCDNNASTGYQINGIGAETGINLGTKTFYLNTSSGSSEITPYDIGFIALPTVTSDTFEIAIDRHATPGGNDLFTNNTIKICFYDSNSGGDYMPDYGSTFSYTFDNNPVEPYEYINFAKNNSSDIRLLTYNTLSDGLTDNARNESFKRIITAVNPDIITFNECWNTSQYEAENILDSWIPLTDTQWDCVKNDNGNITCSKFNITDYYDIDPTSINRVTANIIDLPDSYPRDFIVINSHFKCCDDDNTRQEQSDAIINFIRDIKNSGGALTMPYGTPFVISGDLNLVGLSQQLTTLLTGDIQNNYTYGEDIKPDWDNTDLSDIISFHTDMRVATTWTEEGNDYWPGRFDYTIASDIGATVSKTFTICTEEMSAERLSQYGLYADDTNTASDHLPKITDFVIEDAQNTEEIKNADILIYPNPASNKIFTVKSLNNEVIQKTDIFTISGKLIFSENPDACKSIINLCNMPSGIYFVKIKTEHQEFISKIVL